MFRSFSTEQFDRPSLAGSGCHKLGGDAFKQTYRVDIDTKRCGIT